jgi:hypothetical protein
VLFDAFVDTAPIDAVIGLSNGAPDSFSDLAAIVRFNDSGYLDVRDGSTYRADIPVNYGVHWNAYVFELLFDVDTQAKTYSVDVRNKARYHDFERLASNYHFRTEQAGVASLDHFGDFVDWPTGSVAACYFTLEY